MDKKEILEALNFRHACKEFDPSKKISEDELNIILESARLSPSSMGIEPWKFLIIENEELKKDSVKEVRSMNNIENLKSWILNEWDKKRITVSDIMDATDFGRKSFDKILENDEFNMFLKDNRIKIGTVKGLRKTKYMFKY